MSNLFSVQPELPSPFPKIETVWTCPVTGMIVPKDPAKNLQWRADLLTQAEGDREFQQDLFTASSQSSLFWINTFVFTLRVFESDGEGGIQQAAAKHLPFVTWPIQDTHILRLEHGIDEGESLLTDKSRDMGATWDHIAVYAHRLLFRPDESHLIMSRKEDAVDVLDGQPKNYPFGSLADPGTLFGKIDYILSRLPEWMVPRLGRKKLHIINHENRTRIDGESSNATAGSSDRRDSIFLDEMAKMAEGESIKRSTKDVTACRFPCSTPNGAGTAFSKWRLSNTIPVMALPWWEHPEKGKGRYAAKDDLGRFKIRSPWYDKRCSEDSPKEIAIELDMDHVGSGDTFFETTVVEQHKKLFAKPPKRTILINWLKTAGDDLIAKCLARWDLSQIKYGMKGPLNVWVELIRNRPDQSYSYTVACDISKGQGASNSTISIMCDQTREKIASYAESNIPPHAFARLVCAICMWVGGKNKRPLLIWENNGDPGFDFGNQVTQAYQYSNVYFDRAAGTVREKVGKRWGWRSSPEKKAIALGLLRKAYAHGKFINHDEKSLDEALTYITYEGGGIGPAELVEESDSTRKAHGDRVIADMLCIVGVRGMPKNKTDQQTAPTGSAAERFAAWKKAKMQDRRRTTFDFRGVAV